MNIVTSVVALVWGARIVLNILSYIHLWFVKEYRMDRMMIHLRSPQGKRLLIPPFRRPPLSPKTVALFVGTMFVLTTFFAVMPYHIFINLFIIDIGTFLVIFLLVLVTKIPTSLYHWLLIQRAVARLRAHRPMVVIGITGSYGKTTTKEILATLLSQKYKVLKTEASKNSPIAIAELVLRSLQPDTEAFIVEMGAYKRGEIAYMSAMVRPEIGVVTAINEQHQDLFGSIENTIRAKYELIEGLTGRKIAIMNLDNPYVHAMSTRAAGEGCRVIGYTKKGMKITEDSDGLQFQNTSVHLFGTHQVSNVLAATKTAEAVGMTKDEIAAAMKNVAPFPHTMQPVKGLHGARFIDDTFNNNPDAAIVAIDFLATQKGKKILVFQPMIELGKYAAESHTRVAKRAAAVCDEIILTNDSFADLFSANVLSPKEAARYLNKTVNAGDTVLFKGKEAGRVLQLLV